MPGKPPGRARWGLLVTTVECIESIGMDASRAFQKVGVATINHHPAAPLTDATAPLYEQIAALRVGNWTQCQQTRLQIAELTQKIWRAARDGRKVAQNGS